ncbi:MAG TPA: hypothetical protein VG733_09705 [Chthoniobacteraceae bacterium]|nr:hypothetical protein [Chthoniobacteraceae bacterium]
MKTSRHIFTALILASLALTGLSRGAAPKEKTAYMITYSASGWKVDVYINGVPVLRKHGDGGQAPVESLVVNGPNKLTIKATQADEHARALKVALVTMNEAGESTQVTSFSADAGRAGSTAEKTLDFQGAVPMQWEWQRGEDIRALTPGDQQEIFQLVRKLAACLDGKDLVTHNRLRATFLDQTGSFEGVSHERMISMSDAIYKGIFDKEVAPWEARTMDQLNIESFGKIAVVSSKQPWPDDWTVRVKLDGEDQYYSFYDIWFAKIGGTWVMIN